MVVGLRKLARHRWKVAGRAGFQQPLVQLVQFTLKLCRVVHTVGVGKVKAESTVDLHVNKARREDFALQIDNLDCLRVQAL